MSTGTFTFMFTDIEGSTRLWEQYPEAMQAVLARHDHTLRQAVEANGGQVIKSTGDGIHAAFVNAFQGVCAALAAQQALHDQTWEEIHPHLLRVRMGLHTGEAEMRAGDYFGPTLNRGARLMAVAHGGQVLLSGVTADLVSGQLPAQASIRDLGRHRLKDLVRPEQVFQLEHPSLGRDFAPLASIDSLPNNLPLQFTSFVGRQRELEEARLRLAPARLLTLIGPGGTGKTRLSLQLAAEVLPDYPDGAWLVELAPISDPSLILHTLATVLHIHEQQGMELDDLIVNYLRARHALLVLDNCEHLIDACARLADHYLHLCPGLKILASSREALGINGESVYRVPSLSLLNDTAAAPDAVAASESGQLFIERAAAVDPKFHLTDSNAPSIALICSRLDGIPLAIELAAARVAVLTPGQIASRLDDRFKLLTGGSRAALPRQQTLRALIDWSYETLSQEERALFRRLSVFAGGWTLEAAESLCDDLPALDLLARLVNKSLVVVEEEESERRYLYLETMRQYARDKLVEAGEAEQMRNRHLAFFLDFAETAGPMMDRSEILEWIPLLEAEFDNLRTALEWSLETDQIACLRLVGSLAYFWFRRGYTVEGIHWTSAALERSATPPWGLDNTMTRFHLRARGSALQALSFLRFGQGDNPAAIRAGEEAIAIARRLRDEKLLAVNLSFTATAKAFLGERSTAFTYAEEAVRIARRGSDPFELGLALNVYSQLIVVLRGDMRAAEAYEAESQALLQENGGNWWGANTALIAVAQGAMLRGDFERARQRLRECLPAFERAGDVHRVNMVHSELAHMDRKEGHLDEAEAAYRATILVWQKLGHRAAVAHQLEGFAFIAAARRQPLRAARLLGAAEALREAITIPMTMTERDEYVDQVARLRLALDESSFDALWSEGRDMSMEAAIQYARGGAGEARA